MDYIYGNPGQRIGLTLEIINSNGGRLDGYLVDGYDGYDGYFQSPTIDWILLPSGSFLAGLPVIMTNISDGVYRYLYTVPTGLSAVGNYLASCSFLNPNSGLTNYKLFSLQISLPFGISNVASV